MELKVRRNSLLNRFLSVSREYRLIRGNDRDSSTIIKQVLSYYLKQLLIFIVICFLAFCIINTVILFAVRNEERVPEFILQFFLFLQIIAMDNFITFTIFLIGAIGIIVLFTIIIIFCYYFTIDIYNKIISVIGERIVFTTIYPDQTD